MIPNYSMLFAVALLDSTLYFLMRCYVPLVVLCVH